MQRIVADEALQVDRPELGTRPRVYYKNLHRMTDCLVGGTVVHHVDGIEECAPGAAVVLRQNGKELGRTTTDTFGEFKFDRLPAGSGGYDIEVTGFNARAATTFELGEDSRYLGVITLT